MKRRKAGLSAALAMVLLLSVPLKANADLFAFSSKTERVLDTFTAEYGWDRQKIDASDWTGMDGKTKFSRAAGHQKEYYEDLFRESKEYCVEHNLIKVSNAGGAGGFNIAAIAGAEVDAPDSMEIPPGSNRTKYNDWFYGRAGAEAPWCAIFVSWCAAQCGLIDSGLYRKDAGVTTTYSYMTKENGFASYSWREVKQLGGRGLFRCSRRSVLFRRNGSYRNRDKCNRNFYRSDTRQQFGEQRYGKPDVCRRLYECRNNRVC